ncbi:MAG: KGGVGR-motif variant AAA ATPase [Pikeienuella sp.]
MSSDFANAFAASPPEPESPKSEPIKKLGKIYTFYSFKGGVGRSMSMANIACLLAREGKRVLIVDWDLEAPGLEHFFQPHDGTLANRLASAPGVIDLLGANRPDWRECIETAEAKDVKVDILHSGKASRSNEEYTSQVQRLNWVDLYNDESILIGNYFNEVRQAWREEYDFVLLDSRTGVTDIGDLCTVILPDHLVLLFVTNEQNIAGVSGVYERAVKAHNDLPVDRGRLTVLPVLSRDEFYSEYDKSSLWREKAANQLAPLFADWLPSGVAPLDVLQKIFVPYFAIWSFGEALPVVERPHEVSNPASITAAYSRIAQLIMKDLAWESLEKFADAGETAAARQIERRKSDQRLKEQMAEMDAEANKRSKRIGLVAAAVALVLTGGVYLATQSMRGTDALEAQAQAEARVQAVKLQAQEAEEAANRQIQVLEGALARQTGLLESLRSDAESRAEAQALQAESNAKLQKQLVEQLEALEASRRSLAETEQDMQRSRRPRHQTTATKGKKGAGGNSQ